MSESSKFEIGDSVYLNGTRMGQFGQHAMGTSAEMQEWEREKTALEVVSLDGEDYFVVPSDGGVACLVSEEEISFLNAEGVTTMGSITTKIRDEERGDEPEYPNNRQSYSGILHRTRNGLATSDDAGRVDALVRAAHQWGADGQSLDDFLAWANRED